MPKESWFKLISNVSRIKIGPKANVAAVARLAAACSQANMTHPHTRIVSA